MESSEEAISQNSPSRGISQAKHSTEYMPITI